MNSKLFYTEYYSDLLGYTCQKVQMVKCEHSGELYPTLTFRKEGCEDKIIEVAKDEEGNGAGFLFGLALPQ